MMAKIGFPVWVGLLIIAAVWVLAYNSPRWMKKMRTNVSEAEIKEAEEVIEKAESKMAA